MTGTKDGSSTDHRDACMEFFLEPRFTQPCLDRIFALKVATAFACDDLLLRLVNTDGGCILMSSYHQKDGRRVLNYAHNCVR